MTARDTFGEPDGDATPLGADSLGRVWLAIDLEDALGVEIPDDVLLAWVTVGDVVASVEGLVKAC